MLRVLESLPDTPTLRTLWIEVSTPEEARDSALGPLSKCLSLPALEKLEELEVSGVKWESVRGFDSAKAVWRICKERRIHFLLG